MPVDKKSLNEINVLQLWSRAYASLGAEIALTSRVFDGAPFAALFWGKSAWAMSRAQAQRRSWRKNIALSLGISQEEPAGGWQGTGAGSSWILGDHPLPGEKSFHAGYAILDFFDGLRRYKLSKLHVFLSGGASSLAWLPISGLSTRHLHEELVRLYSAPMTIRELNLARSNLCQLKAGGAARWLKRLAPEVQVEVHLISDVSPFGPEFVGSGPFWNGEIPHRILADNRKLVDAIRHESSRIGIPVRECTFANLGRWQDWVQTAKGFSEEMLARGDEGLLIHGGEPSVKLPPVAGIGGRQTQIAAALCAYGLDTILQGSLNIVAMSSDGMDGHSGVAGACLDFRRFNARVRRLNSQGLRSLRRNLADSLECYDSATSLNKIGALVKSPFPLEKRFNVQDILLVHVSGKQLA